MAAGTMLQQMQSTFVLECNRAETEAAAGIQPAY
jgi:hypothetical protein